MENNNELMHHGTKGMRWGVRRYQNPDGSLTPAGKKRYNKEVEKLKAEEEKIKAAEKVAANKKKTQTKLDKLDAKRAELDERKKKLKNGDVKDPDKKEEIETVEQKRARLMKSTDPKEILKDKDVLTNFELQDRVNRINLEAQLQSKIPAEPKEPTMMDRMDKTKSAVDKATNLYRSVDSAVSTVANSYIGKTLAENLGIELPSKKVDWNKKLNNLDALDPNEMMNLNKRELARDSIEKIKSNRKAAAEAEAQAKKEAAETKAKEREAMKEYEDFQERLRKGEIDNEGNPVTKSNSEPYGKTSKDLTDNITYTRDQQLPAVIAATPVSSASGTKAYSVGESYVNNNASKTNISKVDDIDVIEPDWYTRMKRNGML